MDIKAKLEELISKKEALIEELKAAIEKAETVEEVKDLSAKLEDASKELDELKEALDALNDEKETQDERGFNPMRTYGAEKRTNDMNGDMKQRTAFYNFFRSKGKGGIPEELRDNTLTSDVAAVIPAYIVNKIFEKIEASGMILSQITRTNYAAGVVIPTASVKPVASWVAEGAGSTPQKAEIGKIVFSYFKLRCEVSMSMEVATMSISAFEAWFIDSVSKAMTVAIEKAILAGDGTTSPTGIFTATPAATITTTGTDGAWTYADLVNAESSVPVEYEGNAKWIMTKAEFGRIIGMVDEQGQPIARVNYGVDGKPERLILGREVILHPYATEMGENIAAIYDFSDYVLNTIYDMGIQRKQDWDTEDVRIKAVMSVDGKPVSTESLVVVKAGA